MRCRTEAGFESYVGEVIEMKKKDMDRLCKIEDLVNDNLNAWYGLTGGEKDVRFLLDLLKEQGIDCQRGD